MNSSNIMEGVLELAKSAEELKGARVEVAELKGKKAQLDRDIKLLQKVRKEEKDRFDKEMSKYEKEITHSKDKIQILSAKRQGIVESLKPEMTKLETLKQDIARGESQLSSKEEDYARKSAVLVRRENGIEEKKDVLSEIAKLAKKL